MRETTKCECKNIPGLYSTAVALWIVASQSKSATQALLCKAISESKDKKGYLQIGSVAGVYCREIVIRKGT